MADVCSVYEHGDGSSAKLRCNYIFIISEEHLLDRVTEWTKVLNPCDDALCHLAMFNIAVQLRSFGWHRPETLKFSRLETTVTCIYIYIYMCVCVCVCVCACMYVWLLSGSQLCQQLCVWVCICVSCLLLGVRKQTVQRELSKGAKTVPHKLGQNILLKARMILELPCTNIKSFNNANASNVAAEPTILTPTS